MGALVNKMLFPAPMPSSYRTDKFANAIYLPTRHTISDPARRIPCVLFHTPGAEFMVIYSHGNACDMGEMYADMQAYAKSFNVHLLAWEMPGYGVYSGYKPSEGAVNETLEDVYYYIRFHWQWPASRMIFFGRSIGSGPTVKLVADLTRRGDVVGGMILQSAYTSIRAVAKHISRIAAKAIKRDRWPSIKRIGSITCPVLFIHGKRDTLIISKHSEKLFHACGSKKKFLELRPYADHNYWYEKQDIIDPCTKFIYGSCVVPKGPKPDIVIKTEHKMPPDRSVIEAEVKSRITEFIVPEAFKSKRMEAMGSSSGSNASPPAAAAGAGGATGKTRKGKKQITAQTMLDESDAIDDSDEPVNEDVEDIPSDVDVDEGETGEPSSPTGAAPPAAAAAEDRKDSEAAEALPLGGRKRVVSEFVVPSDDQVKEILETHEKEAAKRSTASQPKEDPKLIGHTKNGKGLKNKLFGGFS